MDLTWHVSWLEQQNAKRAELSNSCLALKMQLIRYQLYWMSLAVADLIAIFNHSNYVLPT